MKKLTITFIAIALLLGINSNAFSQSIAEGDVQIRAYYGYPYFAGAFIKSALETDSTGARTDITVKNTNHIGGGAQFLISDKVGLGVDYTFAKVSATYIDGVDKYNLSLTKHRVTAMMSFHFATGESVDPYFNVGAGYKKNILKYNEPGFDDTEAISQPIPVSMRLGIGMNYFFTDAIGINAEIGLGGPLVHFGIVAKF